MNRQILLFVLAVFCLNQISAKPRKNYCDECVHYNFESDYSSLFSYSEGLCIGLEPWVEGKYSSIDVEGPNDFTESFVTPQADLSCVTSFPFSMTGGGTIRANVYINNSNSAKVDQVQVLAEEIVPGGIQNHTMGIGFRSSSDSNFQNGWQTLTFSLFGSKTVQGHIIFVGVNNPSSTVLVDAFCYSPPGYDGDCFLKDYSTAAPETSTSVDFTTPTDSTIEGNSTSGTTGTTSEDDFTTPAATDSTSGGDSTTSGPSSTTSEDDSTTSDVTGTTSGGVSTTFLPTDTTSDGNLITTDVIGTTSGGVSTTSIPTETTSDGNFITTDVTGTTSGSVSTTSIPTETTSDGNFITTDVTGTTSGGVSTTSIPTETTSDGNFITTDVTGTTSGSVSTTSIPTETTSDGNFITTDVTGTTSGDISTTSIPTETTSDGNFITTDVTGTTSESVSTTSIPTETTSNGNSTTTDVTGTTSGGNSTSSSTSFSTASSTTPGIPTVTVPITTISTQPPVSENGCPTNPSIHWLLPHEYDCNLFYYCVWGDKILRNCDHGLHFNPVIQVCDWPWSAGCSLPGSN